MRKVGLLFALLVGVGIVAKAPAQVLLDPIQIGGQIPRQIAVNTAANKIYVANTQSQDLGIYDATSFVRLKTIRTPQSGWGIAFNPSTNKIYLSGPKLTVVDALTETVSSSVTLPRVGNTIAINTATNRVFVTVDNTGNNFFVIDGTSLAVLQNFAVGGRPQQIAVNQVTNEIYTANFNDNTVTAINGSTFARTTISLGAESNSPIGIAVNTLTNRVFVTRTNPNRVTTINGATKSVINSLAVPAGYANWASVDESSNTLLFTQAQGGKLAFQTQAPIATTQVTVGANPTGALAVPAVNRYFTADGGSNTITVGNLATKASIATVITGAYIRSYALDLTNNVAVLGTELETAIQKADLSTGVVTRLTPLAYTPTQIAVDPANNVIYALEAPRTLRAYDSTTGALLGSRVLGSGTVRQLIVPGPGRIVSVDSTGSVLESLGSTLTAGFTTALPTGTYSVARLFVNAGLGRLYVLANRGTATWGLFSLDLTTGADTNPVVDIVGASQGSTIDAVANKLYVAATEAGVTGYKTVDLNLLTVSPVTAFGATIEGISLSSNANEIYVASSNFAYRVNAATGSVLSSVATPNTLRQLATIAGRRIIGFDQGGANLQVIQEPNGSSVAVSAVAATPGATVALQATLTQAPGGTAVAGKTLRFFVDATEVGNAVTGADGSATLNTALAADLAAGPHVIFATFDGEPALAGTTGSASLSITKNNTVSWAGNRSGMISQVVALRGNLKNTTLNQPYPDKTLTFRVGSIILGTAVTGADGNADLSVALPDTLVAGVNVLTVSFAGDAVAQASTFNASLTVTKSATTLWVGNRSGKAGVPLNFRTLLQRAGDRAGIAGRTVTITIAGGTPITLVTGADGFADTTQNVPALAPGTYPITVTFAGDGAYLSTTGTGTLTILP
ncbi:MAG: hypothetical protein ACOYON_07965 [Fimbriimonas sp.]